MTPDWRKACPGCGAVSEFRKERGEVGQMIKTCEFCLSEFEGAAQARFCSDAHRKAFRRRFDEGRRASVDPDLPERQVDEPEPEELDVPALVAAAKAGRVLSDSEEQRIRDYWGYAPSETRTWAEREQAAQRIMANLPEEPAWLDEMVAELERRETEHREKQRRYRESLRRVPSP